MIIYNVVIHEIDLYSLAEIPCFVRAFQDDKVSEILELPKDVRPIGIICIGYPAEKPEKLERIDIDALVHYEATT